MASPADILSEFFLPGGGALQADNGLQLAALQSARRKELETRVAADPTDQRSALLLKFLGRDEAQNPYSDTAVGARDMATQGAIDAATRSMLPEVQAAKNLSIAQAGAQKHAEAYGTDLGKAQAADSDVAQQVLNAASHRKIQETLAPNRAMLGEETEGPFAGQSFGGDEGGSSVIDDLAKQYAADPSYPVPPALKTAVAARATQLSSGLNGKITNQTRQMSESANDLLPMIDQVIGQAKELQAKGLFNVAASPIRSWLADHGAATLMGINDQDAQQVGRFQDDLGLLQSGVARAHAGARGAGNSDMAERFQALMGAKGDLPTFLGQLQGVRDLLSRYASHTNPAALQGIQPAPSDPLGIR